MRRRANVLPPIYPLQREQSYRMRLPKSVLHHSYFDGGIGVEWAKTASAPNTAANDTLHMLGTQSIKCHAENTGQVWLTKVATVDLSARPIIKLLVYIDDVANLNEMYLKCSSGITYAATTAQYNFMSNLDNPVNGWNILSINRARMSNVVSAPDWSAITQMRLVTVAKSGVSVNVYFNELKFYSNDRTKGTVCFNFDLFYDGVADYVMPEFMGRGWKATLAAHPIQVGAAGYMTLGQIHTACDLAGFDIANHGWNAADLTALTEPEIITQVEKAERWIADNGLRRADLFTYPNGNSYNRLAWDVVKRYYNYARCGLGSYDTGYLMRPQAIRTVYVQNTTTLAALKANVDLCESEKNITVFLFHQLTPSPSAATQWDSDAFVTDADNLCKYIGDKETGGTLEVLSFSEILENYGGIGAPVLL